MNNKQQYLAMSQGEAELEISYMYAFSATPVTALQLEQRIQELQALQDIDIEYNEDDNEQFMLRCTLNDEPLLFNIAVRAQDDDDQEFTPYYSTDPIAPELLAQVNSAPSMVFVESLFTQEPLASFRTQLQLLQWLVPNILLGVDQSAGGRVFTKEWLNFQLEADVLPNIESLYVIHAIYDNEEDPPSKFWFHTHGLLRCGIPEVDLIFPHSLGDYYGIDALICSFVGQALNEGKVKFAEPILCGQTDETQQYIVALPFEEGLRHMRQQTPLDHLADLEHMHFDLEGAPEGQFLGDKADRDEHHQHPSCVLFKTTEENPILETFFAGFADNERTMFYRPTSETAMMSYKAQLRWDYFRQIFADYGQPKKSGFLSKLLKAKEEKSEFGFMIKCGIVVDEDDGREHMWFVPKEVNGDNFVAELINSPYYATDMKRGGVYSLDKTQITDWVVYYQGDQYTPDSIYKLRSPQQVH